MPEPGHASWVLDRIFHHLAQLARMIPVHLHMLASALFPIFTGAHASLSRPITAAKPTKRQLRKRDGGYSESTTKMEGLSAVDALIFPITAGCVLGFLYLLIKWLEDPAIISKIINYYISVVGVFSIAKFLADCTRTMASFLFPRRYSDQGLMWELDVVKNVYRPSSFEQIAVSGQESTRESPLPGVLSRFALPASLNRLLWYIRGFLYRPKFTVRLSFFRDAEGTFDLSGLSVVSFIISIGGLLYFNLVSKQWWLYNVFGAALCYNAMQLMSPTTFWTGTLILITLFFYDIYMVFFTPMMITVASKLDVPVKMLFPQPRASGSESKRSFSLLGLGDILIPGMIIGLALRFDLYMFYLKHQIPGTARSPKEAEPSAENVTASGVLNQPHQARIYGKDGIGKLEYRPAAGNWGERFWLGPQMQLSEGSSFPKPYFYAGILGYVGGMISTFTAMSIFDHGQPALLHLVPGVLSCLWATAYCKGELKEMWEYSELDEAEEKRVEVSEKNIDSTAREPTARGKQDISNIDGREEQRSIAHGEDSKTNKKDLSAKDSRVTLLTLSLPKIFFIAIENPSPGFSKGTATKSKRSKSTKDRSRSASEGLANMSFDTSSEEFSESDEDAENPASGDFVSRGKRTDGDHVLKRRRIA